MPAWARRSRPDRVRAPSKDAVKHRRSMPRISSAIAGWLLVKTRSGSLPGEGNLPIETVTVLNAKTAKARALTVPPSMVLRADEVIELASANDRCWHQTADLEYPRIGCYP